MVAQAAEPMHELVDRVLQALPGEVLEAVQGAQQKADRTIAPDGQDGGRRGDPHGQYAGDHGRGPEPADRRQPRHRDEEDEQDRDDVVEALEDHGGRDLHGGRTAALVEHEHARRLACARGHDVVVEVADDRRVHDDAAPRPPAVGEERAPAQAPQPGGHEEEDEGRDQPPVIAGPQRRPGVLEIDAAERDVGEHDGHHDRRDLPQEARRLQATGPRADIAGVQLMTSHRTRSRRAGAHIDRFASRDPRQASAARGAFDRAPAPDPGPSR